MLQPPQRFRYSFNLSERGVKLKKGYSYFFDISAVDGAEESSPTRPESN